VAREQLEEELMGLKAARDSLEEQQKALEADLAATKDALQTARDHCEVAEVGLSITGCTCCWRCPGMSAGICQQLGALGLRHSPAGIARWNVDLIGSFPVDGDRVPGTAARD
jgi:hypothetical protein